MGLTPFLMIPNAEVQSISGQAVNIYWTSNLCDKNGETPTSFAVTVKRGQGTVYTETVTGTASNPAAQVTVPGTVLTYSYDVGATNKFTVEVSAEYQGKTYTAQATIDLASRPAVVRFDKLSSYYITDTQGPVSIRWSVENFDRYSAEDSSDLFKLLITKDGRTVYESSDPGAGSGSFTGSYSLGNLSVTANSSDPASYRDVYTVTIQAKNGADSTWSYDSFLLYVYDEDALKIWVKGENDDSQEDLDRVTISNVPQISQMNQEQILALKRDITLKNIISVNYGEYAWSELADQIAWKSSDNSVVTINYQQGTLYENINSFSYVSYRPTSDFGLSGQHDGTASITATHKLTGMQDDLDVTVETLTDKLYLFQCYPQAEATLTYTNGNGQEKSVTSDETGAAAIYEESGIASDVYCSVVKGGITYLGTFSSATLKTGEGDWTQLERYPCNNLELRRAAYAYIYVKNPDGTPYTGSLTFRGGVYMNDTYLSSALFGFNGGQAVNRGDEDITVTPTSTGKLEILMDQTQWNIPGNELQASDKVNYVFELLPSGDAAKTPAYAPLLVRINANGNFGDYVGSGEAIVNFRTADQEKKPPLIVTQEVITYLSEQHTNVMDYTGYIGPSDNDTEISLVTEVLWWGADMEGLTPNLQLFTTDKKPVAAGEGEFEIEHNVYPFTTDMLTRYTVKLDEDTLGNVVSRGSFTSLYLEYYKDSTSKTVDRHEDLPFSIFNMLGQGKVQDSNALQSSLKYMGKAIGTEAQAEISLDDIFVLFALTAVADQDFTKDEESTFQMALVPTGDPTKFRGIISVNVGGLKGTSPVDEKVSGITVASDGVGKDDYNYMPGFKELMVLTRNMAFSDYWSEKTSKYENVLNNTEGAVDFSIALSGYMECMVYYNTISGIWEIQILKGGFSAGGGLNYTRHFNTFCGPVPINVSLTIGGTAEVSMNALAVSYFDKQFWELGIGNDFLTQLRIGLYLRLFAGVGFDYSVVALKLGIFGQINLDMQFQWLNRPYMKGDRFINMADGTSSGNMSGQRFRIDGQVGLEFLVKILFVSYDKIIYSASFQLLDQNTGKWMEIQDSWKKNKNANQLAIDSLKQNNSLTTYRMGGQQILALNLAPTLESRDYLEDGARTWGDGGISLFSLDADNGLANLESNTYPYANPVVSDDGKIVAYLSDMGSSDSEATRVAYATKSGNSYNKAGAIDDAGYGDNQLSLAGTTQFAAAAWTRQTLSLNKDSGAVLTDADQMMMINSSEVYASIYNGSSWTTTCLTENASPDLAPVVAVNGSKAIAVWRSVSSSGAPVATDGAVVSGITTFDERDTIVYKIYENGSWGDTQTLYNGTSGMVKGLVTAMMDDGTAAIAYTLDTDSQDSTTADREIVYAIVGQDGLVNRNVRATNDAYLDENPQLTVVTFGNQQRFVLGWYTEQATASDDAAALDGGQDGSTSQAVSDIRLLEFDATGTTAQLLPDSISQAATAYDVSITSNFRFTKNSDTINDLSILWVERAKTDGESISESQSRDTLKTECDVLKGIKFYTYGQNNELVTFTGAVDVAEMPDATLIDHFDAYVSDPSSNEIKAVILGTTYGAQGIVTRTAETVGGDIVQYSVPSRTSDMYTATETYQDKIEVPAFLADYETVKKGALTQLQFTVDNKGIHAINHLTIQIGSTTTDYDNLNLLPGSSIQLMADYQVPESGVVNPTYTVTATFDQSAGATGTAETGGSRGLFGLGARDGSNVVTGTVYLDLPDIEITEAKIVQEENGERTIQIKLNNQSDAVLTKDNRKVKISFYTDATYQTPLEGLDPITISAANDLAMLDEGGYSTQVTFNVGDYVKVDGAVQEIPENGVNIYMKAEVLNKDNNSQGEPLPQDNYASVTCDNLKVRTGKDVTMISDLETTEDGTSAVSVTLQNTRLATTTTGNVIATLLDADGNILEQLQSYTGMENDTGLITLHGEEKKTVSFSFSQAGHSVQITYSDLVLNADNANLSSLHFEGLPDITLDSFVEDTENPGIYRATVSADDLTTTTVVAAAESALAKVRLSDDDAGSNAICETVTLIPGETNTITVSVQSNDGSITKTYILTVQNNGEPTISEPTVTIGESFGTSVVYDSGNSATIKITATQNPVSAQYQLSYQWYSCDVNGSEESREELTGEDADTLTVPSSLDTGVYYYICKVSRAMTDGSVTDYWSTVASIQITKATDNYVTLTGTTVPFDNQPHTLTSASAAKAGSTLYYSTDGETWSTESPAFTAVGVHTVQVYAKNPNYEDTAIVTADVVIQENAGLQFKLETSSIEDAFNSYPEAIKSKYADANALTAALKTEVTKLGASANNTEVYDIKLLFSLDGGATWTEATAENFPEDRPHAP